MKKYIVKLMKKWFLNRAIEIIESDEYDEQLKKFVASKIDLPFISLEQEKHLINIAHSVSEKAILEILRKL